ncbi:O-antigen ligase family protein [Bacteroides caecimuris]|uniref:O-antigen ligase family protein n=1 Tax=Bacteroides caecimuris TaxID=1796613 RepID=UPI0020CDFD95|nr:O-antigen ligase family protein [Bacteroides caecimuris]
MMTDKQQRTGNLSIAIIGTLEAVLVILQNYGWVESEHLLFNCTGSFFNPGLAGGFLACSFCISGYLLITTHICFKKICLFISCVLQINALVLTHSRAGWIVAIIGLCYLLWHTDGIVIQRSKAFIKKNLIVQCIIIGIAIIAAISAYQYKKASADGRLFIWGICLDMSKDKIITGHGTGMFREKFPNYQAAFFMQNPDSDNVDYAGNPLYPFNEYLSVLVTQGLIGVAFLILMVISLFFHSSSKDARQQRAFLLTWGVFACFSYPMAHYRLMILLPFLIALLPITGRTLRSHLGWWTKIIILGVIISGIYVGISGILTYSKLEKAYNKHERISQELYNDIKYDLTLLNHYYNSIANKLPACEEFYLLKEYVELYPSSYGLCELGRRYKSRKLFSRAKECFIFAYHINPSLIVPQYELFLLYQEEENMNQMVAIGERILHQPVKQENTISIKIKTEVRKVLREHLTKNMVTK